MKITRNKDGTVTVSVTKGPEEYDPTYADGPSGGLVFTETVSAAEFAKAAASRAPAKERVPRRARRSAARKAPAAAKEAEKAPATSGAPTI